MDADFLKRLNARFRDYVDTYRVDGNLPPMMQLKVVHIAFVVANARKIAEGEGFDPLTVGVCVAAAQLHDTGRFEQLRLYDTFRDSDSVDHAVFSHDIVEKLGWLDELPPNERKAILDAVLFHNRREIPDGLDPLTQAAAKTVRDADKLDIFRVLEEQVRTTDWRHDNAAFWRLPVFADPNPKVLAAIRENRPVDYQNISSLADFVLIQVGWIRSGLYYDTTRRLVAERKHLEFRRDFISQLTSQPLDL